MASDLKNHVNIGKDTEQKLIQVGVDSFEKLAAIGSEEAFIRLQKMDPGACLSLLYGLEGAIEGVEGHKLTIAKKQELQQFFKMAKKAK